MNALWHALSMSFKTEISIHFDEADPAGIAFSGGVFTKMHRCYEEFITALGQNPQKFFLNPEVIFPLRHMEADYFAPLMPLEKYQVSIGVLKNSDTSFQLQYEISKGETKHCVVRSTHVCVDKSTMKKTAMPSDLKQNLETFVIPQ